jgi:hypothetical protein
MSFCKRILAALTFLVAAAMLLVSLAAGVGVWVVKRPVTDKAMHVYDRVDEALGIAEQNLDQLKATLVRAAERLDSAREEQRKIAREPQGIRGVLARKLQQRIAPEIDNAHEKFHTVAEAALVVNAVLEDLGNFPFLSSSGLDIEGLSEMNGRLSQVEATAWDLSRLLSDPSLDAEASDQLSRIGATLTTLQGWIAEFEPRLTAVRHRTEEVKSRALTWVTPAAAIISVVCFWIALSQVSLLCHACSWWRNAGCPNPRALST